MLVRNPTHAVVVAGNASGRLVVTTPRPATVEHLAVAAQFSRDYSAERDAFLARHAPDIDLPLRLLGAYLTPPGSSREHLRCVGCFGHAGQPLGWLYGTVSEIVQMRARLRRNHIWYPSAVRTRSFAPPHPDIAMIGPYLRSQAFSPSALSL